MLVLDVWVKYIDAVFGGTVAGHVFCLNQGSANDFFFDDPTNPQFDSLNIMKVSGTAGQIQGLLDGVRTLLPTIYLLSPTTFHHISPFSHHISPYISFLPPHFTTFHHISPCLWGIFASQVCSSMQLCECCPNRWRCASTMGWQVCDAIELTLEDLNKWGSSPTLDDEYRLFHLLLAPFVDFIFSSHVLFSWGSFHPGVVLTATTAPLGWDLQSLPFAHTVPICVGSFVFTCVRQVRFPGVFFHTHGVNVLGMLFMLLLLLLLLLLRCILV